MARSQRLGRVVVGSAIFALLALIAPRGGGQTQDPRQFRNRPLEPIEGSPRPEILRENPITMENRQKGTTAWTPGLDKRAVSSDSGGEIKGYASATSVNQGETISFQVSVNPAQAFTMEIYRMGWYQGTGGRLMKHVGPLSGIHQPDCRKDSPPPEGTGLVECQWAPTYSLSVPSSWTSGIYIVHLINSHNYENYMIFVVRDDQRHADFLYQQPVNTYQAYNNYGGRSLYTSEIIGSNGKPIPGTKVSFDRPYANYGDGQFGVNPEFLLFEVHLVHWLEKMGYDVTYSTSLDTHVNGGHLRNYRAFLSAGHDEYWSREIYDSVEEARDAAVHLAFFGANAAFWQVRYESSSSGIGNRVMVCYKSAQLDPETDPNSKTIQWEDLGRPAQQFIGVQFNGVDSVIQLETPFVVSNNSNWVFNGTGFRDGTEITGILGREVDEVVPTAFIPQNISYTALSFSPLGMSATGNPLPNSFDSSASIYQAPSGAWVFATGTHSWSFALDRISVPGFDFPNPGIEQATKNVLDRFLEPMVIPIYSIYAISDSKLHFYKDLARNGEPKWDPNSGRVIGEGWNFKQVFSGGDGIIYAIDEAGRLHFYKDLARNGTAHWDPNSGHVIGAGWNFKQVFSGGEGVIYAIDEAGHLRFYKDLARDGTPQWDPKSGHVIGNGWNFKRVFADSDGVIYGVDSGGRMHFYRDLARDGTIDWDPNDGKIICTGCYFRQIFSGGNGVIYAIDESGNLFFYKYLRRDGTSRWAYQSRKLIGTGWIFEAVLADH